MWDDRKSKHKSGEVWTEKEKGRKVWILHLMLFTRWRAKWLSPPLNETAISSLLQMSHAWAFTQTQCLISDSKRRVWISTYHIKIVGLCAAVNHSPAPQPPWVALDQIAVSAFPSTQKDKRRQGLGSEKKKKTLSYITKTSFKQGHMPHLPPVHLLWNSCPANMRRKELKGPLWYSLSSALHG